MINTKIENFTKINKTKAKRLYNEGITIFIVPCKIYPSFKNMWIKPFELQYTDEMKQRDLKYPCLAFEHTFNSRINNLNIIIVCMRPETIHPFILYKNKKDDKILILLT